MQNITRCSWVDPNDPIYIKYHDTEWGIPIHDDTFLFELLSLEILQAGLSWKCVLHKRKSLKEAFDYFNVLKIANYSEDKIETLLKNKEIIRNKPKIQAIIQNAKIFTCIQKEFGDFNTYIWHWTNNKRITSNDHEIRSSLSDKISKDLKRRGIRFVGSITIFSYLCAIGIIRAHEDRCFIKNI